MTAIPGRNIIILLLLPLPAVIAGIFYPDIIAIGIMLDIFILFYALFDVLISMKKLDFTLKYETGKLFSIGRKNNFNITIYNKSEKTLNAAMTIDIPEFWDVLSSTSFIKVKPYENQIYKMVFRPSRRGHFPVKHIYVKYTTLSNLFMIYKKIKTELVIKVFPDIKELNRYIHMARQNRLSDIGIHKKRYTGFGTELEYLREYQKDDDSKNIEWKVTTRINKTVTKVFQMETNNVITFAVDCGRMMTAEQEGINSLDYAINALLILSHVSLKIGDTVNIIAYSDKIIGELSNVKGKYSIRKINHFLSKLKPEFVESNYKHAFEFIKTRIKKRSLILFFTDIIDDLNYYIFRKYISLLNKKHLTLFILLRDYLLMKSVNTEPEDADELFSSTTAKEMFMKRNDTITKLRVNNINVLDVLPKQTTPRLIDKYLEMKSRNLI